MFILGPFYITWWIRGSWWKQSTEEFVALDIKIVGENFLNYPQELEWKRDRGLTNWPLRWWMSKKSRWLKRSRNFRVFLNLKFIGHCLGTLAPLFWKSFVFSFWVLWERESLTGGGNYCFRDQLRPCWNGSGPAVWQDFWEVMGNKYKHLSFWLKGSYVYLISLSFCTNSSVQSHEVSNGWHFHWSPCLLFSNFVNKTQIQCSFMLAKHEHNLEFSCWLLHCRWLSFVNIYHSLRG